MLDRKISSSVRKLHNPEALGRVLAAGTYAGTHRGKELLMGGEEFYGILPDDRCYETGFAEVCRKGLRTLTRKRLLALAFPWLQMGVPKAEDFGTRNLTIQMPSLWQWNHAGVSVRL